MNEEDSNDILCGDASIGLPRREKKFVYVAEMRKDLRYCMSSKSKPSFFNVISLDDRLR